MVYQLAVTLGHQSSTVALGLEPEAGVSSSWGRPLLTKRVATAHDKELVGLAQIGMLLKDEKLAFAQALTVAVADSSYSKPAALHAHRQYPQLVTIKRARGMRPFYQPSMPSKAELARRGKGHPTRRPGQRCTQRVSER